MDIRDKILSQEYVGTLPAGGGGGKTGVHGLRFRAEPRVAEGAVYDHVGVIGAIGEEKRLLARTNIPFDGTAFISGYSTTARVAPDTEFCCFSNLLDIL